MPTRLRSPIFVGLVVLGVLSFIQPMGLTAADTKHDLVANPWQFLSGATTAWTDIFTFGQLQNQAYGYLFPQGLFFALADPLPNWIAQRLWWWLVLGLGYSGMMLLLRRLGFTPFAAVVAATLYTLAPRTLSTLTTISSETWPIMLAPWSVWPLLSARLRISNIAASILAVAAMGAVNATATLAACVPAGFLLLWRLFFDSDQLLRHRFFQLLGWVTGCVLVSLWWILPLLVLGTYASPFTDYIENATVVTRWLNLAEILRGTTSWSPFVDAERRAGYLLATSPIFVIATLLVAAVSLIGLGRRSVPLRNFWIALLGLGLVLLGGASLVTGFLDGIGTPLRNVHKFDLLVRLPLTIGVAASCQAILPPAITATPRHAQPSHWLNPSHLLTFVLRPPKPQQPLAAPTARHARTTRDSRRAAAAGMVLIALAATAPAWSGRLLPHGSYQNVPEYWQEAADFLNENAQGTRTLILPASSFARQTWGWTRDEPAQALLSVPWAVRDAIPLVDPETIRGLDGMSFFPTENNLARHGIGAVIIRHDLFNDDSLMSAERLFPHAKTKRFGQVEVVLLDTDRDMYLTNQTDIPTVAAGGEALAFLGEGTYQLVNKDADIVTDTPLLVARNYGTIDSISAPLANTNEATDVHNPVLDYPSVGPLTKVETAGGQITASSSAADATSFNGANPARSTTAAVDGNPTTAWYPRPGKQKGEWLEIQTPAGSMVENPVLEVTLASNRSAAKAPRVEVTVTSGDAHFSKFITAGKTTKIPVPGGATNTVRLTLGASGAPVGVAEVSLAGVPLERMVTVPNTSPQVQQFVFNRVFSNTGVLERRFFVPKEMKLTVILSSCAQRVTVNGHNYSCKDTITLKAGWHDLKTAARVVWLTAEGFTNNGATNEPLPTYIHPSDTPRLVVTNRSVNSGLVGYLGDTPLETTTVNAGIQAFIIPAQTAGEFRMEFTGDKPFRTGLLSGAAIGIITILGCIWCTRRRNASNNILEPGGGKTANVMLSLGLLTTVGWPALALGAGCFIVLRSTLIQWQFLCWVGMGMAAMWLARAPWPSSNYAGDSLLLSLACTMSVWSVLLSAQGRKSTDKLTRISAVN